MRRRASLRLSLRSLRLSLRLNTHGLRNEQRSGKPAKETTTRLIFLCRVALLVSIVGLWPSGPLQAQSFVTWPVGPGQQDAVLTGNFASNYWWNCGPNAYFNPNQYGCNAPNGAGTPLIVEYADGTITTSTAMIPQIFPVDGALLKTMPLNAPLKLKVACCSNSAAGATPTVACVPPNYLGQSGPPSWCGEILSQVSTIKFAIHIDAPGAQIVSNGSLDTCVDPDPYYSFIWPQLQYSTPGSKSITVTAYECIYEQGDPPPVVETSEIYGQAILTFAVAVQGDPGPCTECEAVAGEPVNLSTGGVWVSKTDYAVPGLSGGLSLSRTWNSLWSLSNSPFSAGMFGSGWTSDFEERLQTLDGCTISYWLSSGNAWTFQNNCSGSTYSVVSPLTEHASLAYNSGTSLYTLTFADGTIKTFNSSGYLTAIADRNGNQTTVTYDASNRITTVAAPGGQSLTFTYALASDPGRVTSIQDSVGNVATYSYSNSQLTQAGYPDGGQLNYAYDGNGNITGVTDALGKVIETHTYDSSNRGLTSSRANGVDLVTIQYPAPGTTTLTDTANNSTTYSSTTIAGRSFITGIQGPGCDSCGGRYNQSFTQDSSGNRLSAIDPNGNTTSFTYDASGHVLTRTDWAGTWTYTYNNFGEVLTAKDPLGNTTTNVYDTKGNLTSTTTPSPDGGTTPGSKTQFTYDTKGEPLTVTDPLGNVTTLTYYTTGLLNTIKDAQRNVTTFVYDGRGNRTSVKDPLNNTTTFTYDLMNRLTKITYPTSPATSVQMAYDKRGRRTSVTDANIKTTIYAYDDADRLTSVTDPANGLTQYGYDTENNLTSITDASNHSTGFTYQLGRLTSTLFPSNISESYTYDPNGNLASKTDRDGNIINYAYDQANRLTQKSYPNSTAVNYSYDADSRLTQVTDSTGVYQFTYDNMGRLKSTVTNYSFLTGKTFTNAYSYDAASNRTGYTDPENGATTYSYDSLNRLSSLAPPAAIGGGSFGFSYDALSRRTSMTRPNSVTTSYAYDTLSRLLSVLHKKKTTTLDGAVYTVDNAGNRLTRAPQPTGTASSYTYDPLYQLTAVQQGATTTESYSYDAVGNRATSVGVPSYIYNGSNELTSSSLATFIYDNNGNTLSKAPSGGTTTYTWDYENRLASVTLPGSGGTVTFKYDPFGRRIYKSSSGGTSIFAYDGQNLVEETSASGTTVARYTQGESIDEPLAMLRSSATSYYDADGLGSVTSLTNSSGSIVATYTLDGFGNLKASTGSIVSPFRFTGRELDSETGLYFYRARYYDPTTGRFISEDPLEFGGGRNFYSYTRNDPVALVDPSGLTPAENNVVAPLMPGDTASFFIANLEDPRLKALLTPTADNHYPPGTRHYGESQECVALTKEFARLPCSGCWRAGPKVVGNNIPAGTAIATFDAKGLYPNNSHNNNSGLYVGTTGPDQPPGSFLIIDQWRGHNAQVRSLHPEWWRGPSDRTGAYSVITVPYGTKSSCGNCGNW